MGFLHHPLSAAAPLLFTRFCYAPVRTFAVEINVHSNPKLSGSTSTAINTDSLPSIFGSLAAMNLVGCVYSRVQVSFSPHHCCRTTGNSALLDTRSRPGRLRPEGRSILASTLHLASASRIPSCSPSPCIPSHSSVLIHIYPISGNSAASDAHIQPEALAHALGISIKMCSLRTTVCCIRFLLPRISSRLDRVIIPAVLPTLRW